MPLLRSPLAAGLLQSHGSCVLVRPKLHTRHPPAPSRTRGVRRDLPVRHPPRSVLSRSSSALAGTRQTARSAAPHPYPLGKTVRTPPTGSESRSPIGHRLQLVIAVGGDGVLAFARRHHRTS